MRNTMLVIVLSLGFAAAVLGQTKLDRGDKRLDRAYKKYIGLRDAQFRSKYAQSEQVRMLKTAAASNERFFGITLCRNGKTAYFVDSRGGRDTMTLVQSVFKDGVWQKPVPLPFSTKPGVWKDMYPFLSPDEKTLFFSSNRPTAENPKKSDFDLWAVKKTPSGWGEPYNLGDLINSEVNDYFSTMSRNGNIYFSSDREGGFAPSDIYVSRVENGKYQSPLMLSTQINTDVYNESHPYISPEEDYLIFAINNSGYGGSDLYISFNQKGVWSTPEIMGSKINTQYSEFAPLVHNGILYFSRTMVGKPLRESIYFTKLTKQLLKKLRQLAELKNIEQLLRSQLME